MGLSTECAKDALRAQVQACVKEIPSARREEASAMARVLITRQAVWKNARSVLFFASLMDELDLWPLLVGALSAGKVIALPRFQSQTNNYVSAEVKDLVNDIRIGKFGIREPAEHCAEIALNRLDLVLAPGVAFDLHGHRLGRGKGIYDRLLAAVRGPTCGVAFDEQIVPQIPVAPHDVHVNCILTPTRWIEVTG